ncbi:unnamed protein product [Arabidopsis thaliana]|uniref:Uncharacterized protein n=1 Tax=Arabidopsis thaliana TaxID=3702 RepID=Q9FHT9_ARATH|nr:unnamed protein product [Arabidopsis thaliana]
MCDYNRAIREDILRPEVVDLMERFFLHKTPGTEPSARRLAEANTRQTIINEQVIRHKTTRHLQDLTENQHLNNWRDIVAQETASKAMKDAKSVEKSSNQSEEEQQLNEAWTDPPHENNPNGDHIFSVFSDGA